MSFRILWFYRMYWGKWGKLLCFAKITHSAPFGGTVGFYFIISRNEKVVFFIDGSNLYHKLKDLQITNTSDFNYEGLCQKLARDREIVSRCYYVGAIRAKENDAKGQDLRANQLNLFNNLQKQGFSIEKGNFLFNGGKYHEKGVDVKLAVDLLVGAYEKKWDVAIVISSDSDLNPAIQKVKQLKKGVEYIGFSHNPCYALQKSSSLSRLLIKEDIDEFIASKLPL